MTSRHLRNRVDTPSHWDPLTDVRQEEEQSVILPSENSVNTDSLLPSWKEKTVDANPNI